MNINYHLKMDFVFQKKIIFYKWINYVYLMDLKIINKYGCKLFCIIKRRTNTRF